MRDGAVGSAWLLDLKIIPAKIMLCATATPAG